MSPSLRGEDRIDAMTEVQLSMVNGSYGFSYQVNCISI